MGRNSRMAIDEYTMGKGEDRGIMKLFRGKVQSIVKRAVGFFGNKKKNRFEIHTPTAVCGVRGTNFFTWFTEGRSGAAVKEGTVYSYSAAKPAEVREVNAGESMIVVSKEGPPVVRPATDQDLTLDEDEDGAEPMAFVDDGPATGGTDPVTTPGDTSGVDDGNTTYIPPAVTETETFTLFSADMTGGFLDGTLNGEISDTTNTGTFGVSGAFTAPDHAAQGQELAGTMSDGSDFIGLLGGVTGSWEGVFSSLYVTDAGGAGYLYGTLSGSLDGADLDAAGPVGRSAVYGRVIQPADGGEYDLAGNLAQWDVPLPTLDGPDAVSGSTIAGIDLEGGRRLGVWAAVSSGGAAPADFSAGTYASFGQSSASGYGGELNPGFIPLDIGYGGGSAYYMAGYLKGEDDGSGHVKITDDGTIAYMDYENLGSINLWYRGYGDGETYRSVTAGTYTLAPLAHVGETEGFVGHAVNRTDQTFQNTAYLNGLFGGVESLWNGSDRLVTAVGAYQTAAGGIRSIWGSEIESYNAHTGQYTTYADENGGVGAYSGWMAGIKQDSALSGKILALYLAPDGSAGTFFGDDLAGFMNDAGAYWMAGTVNRIKKADLPDLTPEDFESATSRGYGSVMLAGSLGSKGTVAVATSGYGGMAFDLRETYGPTMGAGFQTSAIDGEDWGIYQASIFGDFSNPEKANTWTSRVGGSGVFGSYLVEETFSGDLGSLGDDGNYYGSNYGYWAGTATQGSWKGEKLSAELSGKVMTRTWIGEITGDILGTYNDAEGLWEAVSLGTWNATTPLAFVGELGGYGYGGGTGVMHTARAFSNTYNYSDSQGRYEYQYYSDNSYARTYEYRNTEYAYDDYTRVYYYSDGTKETYIRTYYGNNSGDYNSYNLPGTWNVSESLADMVANPPRTGGSWAGEEGENLVLVTRAGMDGLLGGTTDLFDETPDDEVTVMGSYSTYSGEMSSIWYTRIGSYNYLNDTETTYTGGAFAGLVSGIHDNGTLEGRLLALYMAPDGEVGYLMVDDLAGSADVGAGTFEMAGTANRIAMGSTDTVQPEMFGRYLTPENLYEGADEGGFAAGSIELYDFDGQSLTLNGQDWGIWGGQIFGEYAGTASDAWWMTLAGNTSESGDYWLTFDGNTWSDGRLSADVAGAWVNWSDAATGVMGGDLKGTFNADSATWEAVAAGGMIETGKFLDMVANNKAALAALNIPSFEVGRIDLAQTAGGFGEGGSVSNVAMNDVTFFASQSGGSPAIWATDKVSGSYAENPLGAWATLQGGGLTVDFQVDQWHNGQWGASVNGGGTPSGVGSTMDGTAITMTGAAAGVIDKNLAGETAVGQFSGTSAGAVR